MNPILLMRAIFSYSTSLLFLCILALAGCKKQTEEFTSEPLSDFLPLQTGKYITYRLDSTVFPESGRSEEVRTYQEKFEIAEEIPDNLGRPSYRLDRYIRDFAGQNTWTKAGAMFITPAGNGVEVISDNLRILKLVFPVTDGNSWKGNRYISSGTTNDPEGPYSALYEFNDDAHIHIDDWDYTYENKGETVTLNDLTIDDVVTVTGPDEAANAPVMDPGSFGSRTFSREQYAKNIGLVYQELILWEYQPNPNGTPFKVGFGVKRSIIDHNW